MKRMLLIVLSVSAFLFCASSYGQKIRAIEVDKFTNQKRVQTEDLLILNTPAKWPHLYIGFRSVDTSCFITLHGENVATGIVGPADIAYILLADKSRITIYSTGLQTVERNMGGSNEYYSHQYKISLADVYKLTQNNVTSIRRYYNSKYGDIDVISDKETNRKLIERSLKHAEDAKELATVFYKEVTNQ